MFSFLECWKHETTVENLFKRSKNSILFLLLKPNDAEQFYKVFRQSNILCFQAGCSSSPCSLNILAVNGHNYILTGQRKWSLHHHVHMSSINIKKKVSCNFSLPENDCLMFEHFEHLLQQFYVIWKKNKPSRSSRE